MGEGEPAVEAARKRRDAYEEEDDGGGGGGGREWSSISRGLSRATTLHTLSVSLGRGQGRPWRYALRSCDQIGSTEGVSEYRVDRNGANPWATTLNIPWSQFRPATGSPPLADTLPSSRILSAKCRIVASVALRDSA